MAFMVATWSKDPTKRVGAVVVTPDLRQLAIGYNGFPRGIADEPERLSNAKTRLLLSVHAERNAMDNATFPLIGATLYATYFPCHECVKSMVQRGIGRVVVPPRPKDKPASKWTESWAVAEELILEAGIDLDTYTTPNVFEEEEHPF
jgi:dCMP deaminase